MSNSVQPHMWQPTMLLHPWDSPGKNTVVGCHFLLLCIKVKSESEVTQSCLTLPNPMDCSLPGSSVHGIFQARVLEWVAIAFSKIYWVTLYQVFYFTDLLNIYFPVLPHFVLWSFGLIIWSLITCNIYFLGQHGSKRLLLQIICVVFLLCFAFAHGFLTSSSEIVLFYTWRTSAF